MKRKTEKRSDQEDSKMKRGLQKKRRKKEDGKRKRKRGRRRRRRRRRRIERESGNLPKQGIASRVLHNEVPSLLSMSSWAVRRLSPKPSWTEPRLSPRPSWAKGVGSLMVFAWRSCSFRTGVIWFSKLDSHSFRGQFKINQRGFARI